MRDVKLTQKLVTETDPTYWTLDLDIIDGQPDYVLQESETMDQRAAVSAMMAKGTIPGMRNIGVDWTTYYRNDQQQSYVDVDNQMKQGIQDYANDPNNPGNNNVGKYYPLANRVGDDIQIQIINTEAVQNGGA